MKKIGLFPGSFDPFTKGHEIVVHKSLPLFDEVVIGVGINSTKSYLFSLDRRIKHIKALFKDIDKVRVEQFQKLTVDYCKDINASHIIRGLRDSKDFQYEKSIAHMNKSISGIETVFFLTDQEYSAINASIIREIHKNGGPIESFVTNPEILVS
ncbi:MAG: pantetheine-phosphate adenylyltransferase [bacterium]|nr:pantetheine-phosphate adenylyltransferase [bacterium]